LGIAQDGQKTILGIRQGATENATVVSELLGDLGCDFLVILADVGFAALFYGTGGK
jgi:hypothetical protein